jgi:hypothetical protein
MKNVLTQGHDDKSENSIASAFFKMEYRTKNYFLTYFVNIERRFVMKSVQSSLRENLHQI